MHIFYYIFQKNLARLFPGWGVSFWLKAISSKIIQLVEYTIGICSIKVLSLLCDNCLLKIDCFDAKIVFFNVIQFQEKFNYQSQPALELFRRPVCNSTGGYSLLVTNELFQDWKVLVKSPREILPLSLLLAQCWEMISKGAVILIQKRFNDIFLGFLCYDKVNLKKMAQILFNFCM